MSSLVLNEEVAELVSAVKPNLKTPLIRVERLARSSYTSPGLEARPPPQGFPQKKTCLVCVAFEGPLPWEMPFSVRPTRWQEPVSSWSVRSSLNHDCNQY